MRCRPWSPLQATPPPARSPLGPAPRGRGLVARRAVPAGAPLLAVEAWNALAVSDEPGGRGGGAYGARALADWQAVHGSLPPLLEQYLLSDSNWFTRLVAWLLHVSRHGGGIWPLYRSLLPPGHESLMHFLPEEREELQSRELEALAAKERASILSLHESIFSGSSGDLSALALAAGPEDTLWAASMVNSRCFADEVGGEALSLVVPCADLANHDSSPNAGYRLDADAGAFLLVATRDVAAGEEVTISYLGTNPTKPNDLMLKDHGFVIPGNTNDRLPFSAGDDVQSRALGVPPVPRELDAALLLAAAKGLAASGGSSSGGDAAAAVGRLQAAARSLQPFCRRGGGGGGGDGGAAEAEARAAAQRRTVDALLQQCAAMRAGFATTAETDEALLAGAAAAGAGPAELSPRVRAAVASRLERKRLLAAAEALLSAYAGKL
ncbi:hypothetical protein Rsub_08863 [Raphidocelis subcapitata]|uniref:SET domain-containing protein n=1 Tax=Raphidocelis subcapitata TaxID=307507 RepID=A0A2V0P859_9CHLO|nr:hypothetical protein Rsub_08863 [Raphidocelis subcapitata]|eukprot:GBF96048.1 hypothetical protein Rsub_08863 [Raphidocelis subcapitata]